MTNLADILQSRAITLQFIRFCVVGALNTMVDAAVYAVLTRTFGIAGDWRSLAKATSYVIATGCSLLVNRRFTFHRTDNITAREVVQFYGTVGLGIFINVGVHFVLVSLLGMHDVLAVFVAAGATALWGFSFARFYVFRH